MAKIAKDAGHVHVHTEDGGTVVLAPGDDVPSGVKVPDHVLEGKRQHAEQGEQEVAGPGQFVSSAAHARNEQRKADSAARKAAAKAAADAAKAQEKAQEKAEEAEEKDAELDAEPAPEDPPSRGA